MRINRKTRVGLAVAGSVALIGAAGAAYAGPPWVVDAGGITTGTVAYTASAPGDATTPAVHFTAGAADMTCETAGASGDITLGSTSGDYGTVTGASFNDCLALGLLPMEVTELPGTTGFGDWDLAVTGNKTGSVTPGNVHNIHAHVQDIGTAGATCSMDVDGSVSASFDESSQQLIVNGTTLVVTNVVGCFGLVPDPSTASFTATYDVSNSVGDFHIN